MAFTSIPQTGQYQHTMEFSSDDGNWTEKVYLKTASYTDSLAAAALIESARLDVLPDTLEMVNGVVNVIGPPADGAQVGDAYPMAGNFHGVGTTYTGSPLVYTWPSRDVHYINRTTDCLVLRLEDGSGSRTQRYLHGIPDGEISDNRLTGVFTPIPLGDAAVRPTHASPETATWLQWLEYYLWYIGNNTLMYKNPGGIILSAARSPIGRPIKIKRVGSHKVGEGPSRLHGRASPR